MALPKFVTHEDALAKDYCIECGKSRKDSEKRFPGSVYCKKCTIRAQVCYNLARSMDSRKVVWNLDQLKKAYPDKRYG